MKRQALLKTIAALAATLALTVTVSIAADVGSSGDPLVTLSYLNHTYLNSVLAKVDARIATRDAALTQALAAQIAAAGGGAVSSSYTLVTMKKGQTLSGDIGCELLLRVGTAVCVANSAPGLIDTTDGGSIGGGAALVKNHLYLMTIENRAVRASAETVKVLVRGGYRVA